MDDMNPADIQALIDEPREELNVEVKNWLNGLADKPDKAALAKEIIALANQGGGCILIGFDDTKTGFREAEPQPNEKHAFTQDAIASVVDRYVTPPCQCRVELYARKDSKVQHPVVMVPGDARVPLFASRGDADRNLETARVYIRRPGGKSEQPRTQDDWEKLIARLVEARLSELLDTSPDEQDAGSDLKRWQTASLDAWRQKIEEFAEDDPRRFQSGYWTVSFRINSFHCEGIRALKTALDKPIPYSSGWPPFATRIYSDFRSEGEIITAYPDEPSSSLEAHQYWRMSTDGKGFMLCPMQEDTSGCEDDAERHPKIRAFYSISPNYRMVEVLKFIEMMAKEFGDTASTFQLMVTYHNAKGRVMRGDGKFFEDRPYPKFVCHSESLGNSIEARVEDIETRLVDLIWKLLAPVYVQFGFMELSEEFVRHYVDRALRD